MKNILKLNFKYTKHASKYLNLGKLYNQHPQSIQLFTNQPLQKINILPKQSTLNLTTTKNTKTTKLNQPHKIDKN